jgi:hypothetical protein
MKALEYGILCWATPFAVLKDRGVVLFQKFKLRQESNVGWAKHGGKKRFLFAALELTPVSQFLTLKQLVIRNNNELSRL